MKVASLGSGSRGNATLVLSSSCTLMVDCGFSLRELEARAAQRGFDLASLDAVLVTHEHSDHSAGVAALARRYQLPVYLTHGTANSGRFGSCDTLRCFNADTQLHFGDLQVDAIAVPHDAREPVQYRFSEAGLCAGILTDLGSITPHVRSAFGACDLLLLEFNHDREMLHGGPYPAALKRRVGGDWGHLSNAQAVALLRSINIERLQCLVIAHMSEQNNERARVEALLRDELPTLVSRLHWAEQDGGFSWLELVSEDPVAAY